MSNIKNNLEFGFSTQYAPNIFYTPITQHYFSVAFTDDIKEPTFYDSVVNLLLTAEEGTKIDFLISSYGGRQDSFLALRGALQVTQAEVTGYLLSEACSAAGMLFLCCHNFVVNEFATLHCHTCSYGSYGKSDDVKQQVEHITRQNERIVRSVYEGILSKEEQDLLIAGREFYFDDIETKKRLQHREEMKSKKLQQDIQDQLDTPVDLSEHSTESLEEELKLLELDKKDIQAELRKREKATNNSN